MQSKIILAMVFIFMSHLTGCGMAPENENGRSGFDVPSADNSESAKKEIEKKPPELPIKNDRTIKGLNGAVLNISVVGEVEGWAVNNDDVTQTVTIKFYLNGLPGAGTEIGTTIANLAGYDGDTPGDHRFRFQVPAANCNGSTYVLFAIMSQDTLEKEIVNKPDNFTAYTSQQAGMNYYISTLRPALTGCESCHVGEVNYANHYLKILDPSPAEGGTATNNRLIIKASGGDNHGGGNLCPGGIDTAPCSLMQAWWHTEFD